jgi:hypothetical protein
MKQTYIPFIFLLGALATGCQKLKEDPKASLTPGTYFQTQADLDAAVAAAYTELTPDYAFGFTSRMTSCFGADDLTTDPALNKGDYRAFDELDGNSNASNLLNQWQGPWACAYQATNVLLNYQNVNSTETAKNQDAGQAYFLRAFSYYYLVRVFGPVPVVTYQPNTSDLPKGLREQGVWPDCVRPEYGHCLPAFQLAWPARKSYPECGPFPAGRRVPDYDGLSPESVQLCLPGCC